MKRIPLLVLSVLLVACTNGSGDVNLARYRTATASSSYDYNLTAQLLTDGIVAAEKPACLEVATSGGVLPKGEREWTIDKDPNSFIVLEGSEAWIEYRPHAYAIAADRAKVLCQHIMPDGGKGPKHEEIMPVSVDSVTGALRIQFSSPDVSKWKIWEVTLLDGDIPSPGVVPSDHFISAWMSEGAGNEWVCIDLGEVRRIHGIRLDWIEKADSGTVEVSFNGISWRKVARFDGEYDVRANCRARYVRLNFEKAHLGHYLVSEIEVIGPGKVPETNAGWMLQRASEVSADGASISSGDLVPEGWLPATVPATVLMSYVNAGALPDPNFGDNIGQISESFFNSDFWYRYEFDAEKPEAGRNVFLDFDGINWKAEIYLNGRHLEDIAGAFKRAHIKISDVLENGRNVLAVKIIHNANPGSVKEKTAKWTCYNGGILGADNPTFHASIGWDWITTVRGRNCGLWNEVRMTAEGPVGVADPMVSTRLTPDGLADMTASVIVRGDSFPENGVEVEGWIGDIRFAKTVSAPGEVSFTPEEFPQLGKREMNLWWPVNYGAPTLYDAGFVVRAGGAVSDSLHFKAGIREVGWNEDGGALRLFVNGRRVDPMGGNWGFSEQNLRYRRHEYDIAVDYHRQMNFNMIRNWVGMVSDDEFYEACDSLGLMVWQDFWLANPWDGPDPDDEPMFLDNSEDLVYRIRRHPSIVLYCGRNEGYPPQTIDTALRDRILPSIHPGIPYISSSADGPVSGRGPYRAMPAKYYFENQSGMFHSERGMPNVPTMESLRRMMAPEDFWPQGDMWGKHDFTSEGAQRSTSFNAMVENAFGECSSAEEFTALAQWINYDGYRAMFESENSAGRMGLLLWMSHPCWPSMVWCTYDYYFEPTGAVFGCRKACEPVHIQYNASTGNVEVVNVCGGDKEKLTASASIIGYRGNLIAAESFPVDCAEDSTVVCGNVRKPESEPAYYLKLELTDPSGSLISENFYMLGSEPGNLQAVRTLPDARLKKTVKVEGSKAEVEIQNMSKVPALLVRLILKDRNGDEILPVEYSDNYFALMPGERRTVTVKWSPADFDGAPRIDCCQMPKM